LLWAWVLILALGCVDWLWAHQIGLAFVGWMRPGYMLLALGGVCWIYGYCGRDRRLAEAGHFAALWIAFSLVGCIFTYLAATIGMPLRDGEFVAISQALGFHWLAWSDAIWSHRWIHLLFSAAYGSFLPQIIGSIVYFAHTRQTSRNIELIWIAMLSLIITTIISGLLPAVGPYVHLSGGKTVYLAVINILRTGRAYTFALDDLTGIIKLPSYHAVMLVIFVYVHRPPSRSFVPIAMLNALMLFAIPSEGHHYLIDVIAGAAVAVMCITAFRMTAPDISRQPVPAAQASVPA
jgi:hypothetical protein